MPRDIFREFTYILPHPNGKEYTYFDREAAEAKYGRDTVAYIIALDQRRMRMQTN